MKIIRNYGGFVEVEYLGKRFITPIVRGKPYFHKGILHLLANGETIEIYLSDMSDWKISPRLYRTNEKPIVKSSIFKITLDTPGVQILQADEIAEKVWIITCRNGRRFYIILKNGVLYWVKPGYMESPNFEEVKFHENMLVAANCLISPAMLYWGISSIDDSLMRYEKKESKMRRALEIAEGRKVEKFIVSEINGCHVDYAARNHGEYVIYELIETECDEELPIIIIGKKLGDPLKEVDGIAVFEDLTIRRWYHDDKKYEEMDRR